MSYSDSDRHDVLAHELTHIERLDWPVRMLSQLARALYWFHPLVWLAAARLSLEAERACDDRVLILGSRAAPYAERLLAMARRAHRASFAPNAAAAMVRRLTAWRRRDTARRGELYQRIAAILDPTLRRTTVKSSQILTASLLTLAVVVFLAPARLVKADAEPPEPGEPEIQDATPPPAEPPATQFPAETSWAPAPAQLSVTMPWVNSCQDKPFYGEPITMSLRNADLVETLRSFARLSYLNFVIQPGVSGRITVELHGVPWGQAMEQILKINNLGMEIDGTIVRISPLEDLRREAKRDREIAQAQIPLRTVIRTLSYAAASEVARFLRNRSGAILSDRGTVQVDLATNSLIIRDLPGNIDTVLAVIEILEELAAPEWTSITSSPATTTL